MSSPLSGFTAVPNPIMLPFMAMQSYFMMLLAGEAWQYGKRKISAMKNEDFNALDIQEHLAGLIISMEKAIPSIENSMRDFTPLARTITAEMIKTLPEIAKGFGEGFGDIIRSSGTGAPISNVRLDLKSQEQQRGINSPLGVEIASQQSIDNIQKNAFLMSTLTAKLRTQQKTTAAAVETERLRQLKILQAAPRTLPKIPDVHKIATQVIKPKAGQTQKIARDRFIKVVAATALEEKKLKTQFYSQSKRAQDIQIKKNINVFAWWQNAMKTRKRFQLTLTQLLGRYRW